MLMHWCAHLNHDIVHLNMLYYLVILSLNFEPKMNLKHS